MGDTELLTLPPHAHSHTGSPGPSSTLPLPLPPLCSGLGRWPGGHHGQRFRCPRPGRGTQSSQPAAAPQSPNPPHPQEGMGLALPPPKRDSRGKGRAARSRVVHPPGVPWCPAYPLQQQDRAGRRARLRCRTGLRRDVREPRGTQRSHGQPAPAAAPAHRPVDAGRQSETLWSPRRLPGARYLSSPRSGAGHPASPAASAVPKAPRGAPAPALHRRPQEPPRAGTEKVSECPRPGRSRPPASSSHRPFHRSTFPRKHRKGSFRVSIRMGRKTLVRTTQAACEWPAGDSAAAGPWPDAVTGSPPTSRACGAIGARRPEVRDRHPPAALAPKVRRR